MKLLLSLAFLMSIGTATFAEPQAILTVDLAQTNQVTLTECQVVADKLAAHGQALQIQLVPEQNQVARVVVRQPVTVSGPVHVRFRMRAEGLTGIAEQVRLKVTLRERQSQREHFGHTLAHAVRIGPDKYGVVPLELPTGPAPAACEMVLQVQIPGSVYRSGPIEDAHGPVTLWIDQIEVLAETGPHLALVRPLRVAYRPGETAQGEVALVNPTAQAFTGKLVVTELHGLDGEQIVASEKIQLGPNATATKEVRWKLKDGVGRYLRGQLLDAQGREVHATGDYFAYAKDPSRLATLAWWPSEQPNDAYHYIFVAGPHSAGQIKRGVDFLAQRRRIPRQEHFQWDYNNLAGMLPPPGMDPYLASEARRWDSLKDFRAVWAGFKAQGVVLISYVNGNVWGVPGDELYKQHPDWFVYNLNGDLTGPVDMAGYQNERLAAEFDYGKPARPFFYGQLNPTLPATRRHIADQLIRIAKEEGFEGVRWDVWLMDVKPDLYDFHGRQLAPDWPTADKLWAESIAAVKALVAKEVPNFTWGYNYGGPEENADIPLTLAEKCRNGGWILDEVICTYQEKQSPYHIWTAYVERMVSWGDHIRQLGGIYDPFGFHRGGGYYAADRIYEAIYRLIAGGRFSYGAVYENRASKAGELGHVAYRYNDLFNGSNLRRQPVDQQLITVAAPDTVWWRPTVLLNKSPAGKTQAIVHLVNSPLVAEVEDNPKSEVRPPVPNLKVTCGKQDGKLPARAWIVCAEPLLPEGEPAVQAVPVELQRAGDSVSVIVPSLLYWKTVVFEY